MIQEFFATDIWKYLLGAILGCFLPSPVDPIHFYIENWLYKHKIKRWKFEAIQLFDWYLLDALWYVLLAVVAMLLVLNNISQLQGITTIMTVIGIGVIISVIWRFCSKKRRKEVKRRTFFASVE